MEENQNNLVVGKFNLLNKSKLFYFLNIVLLVLFSVSLLVNQAVLNKTKDHLGISSKKFFNPLSLLSGSGNDYKLSGKLGDDVVKLIIAKGSPENYGAELGITYDKVQQSINILKKYDPDYGSSKIILSGNDFQRYKDVAIRISCEYCCGAKSIVTTEGKAACGCAHSQAMRGLLAYMIKNHGSKYTNDQLLRELARWKGMYFPKQMMKKMSTQIQSGTYTPDVAAIILDLKLPKYNGKDNDAPLPSSIKDLPSMVGGC